MSVGELNSFLEQYERDRYQLFFVMFDRIFLWNHQILDFCLLGFFLITNSISLLVMGLFTLSVSFQFTLRGCMFQEFHLGYPICWHITVCGILLWLFCISVTVLFLTLFGSSLFYSWWAWLELYQFYLFQKKQLLVSLIFPLAFSFFFWGGLFCFCFFSPLSSLFFPSFYSFWALFFFL